MPSAAVLFALQLQQAHADENDLPGVRTGIHMGEVSERRGSDGDVEGLAVDLAARIAGLARPAQVLLSASVPDSARPRLDRVAVGRPIRWQAHGSYRLKGFDEALEIREVGIEGVASLAIPDFAGRPAIAVLPLDNLSPDPAQAFFTDGLAGDLITRLAAWRAFPVIARNSSFRYRGGNLDLKKVGAELGARYLVEGSVRREGDRIRVTAQLIDAPSGEHVWAQTYDREVKDVFALQDEISGTIAASIAGDLSRAAEERARQRGTENLEAWSLYQMGWQRAYRNTREDNAEARRLLERSVALDPRFASALAALSLTNTSDAALGWSEVPAQSMAAALETARSPFPDLGAAERQGEGRSSPSYPGQ
jgi:adenylate cyclase